MNVIWISAGILAIPMDDLGDFTLLEQPEVKEAEKQPLSVRN